MAAQLLERLEAEPVGLARPREMVAQPRAFLLPGADADVDVVALREDPAVAAGNVGQLDDRAPAVAVAREGVVYGTFPS